MTRLDLLKQVQKTLQSGGINDTADAEFILAEAINIKRSQTRLPIEVTTNQQKLVNAFVEKRLTGMPLSIIFGKSCFYGLNFNVNTHVLCPRCETEELVTIVAKTVDKNSKILDLCTGSGTIAITLNKEFGFSNVFASDVCNIALETARKNANTLGANIKFIKSNLFENIKEKFDAIVSNPPYISSKDYESLDIEVKNFEPKIALVGGVSGLEFYEKIIKEAPNYLNKNADIFFEVGYNQAQDVKKLLKKDFYDIKIYKDLAGIERDVSAKYKGE